MKGGRGVWRNREIMRLLGCVGGWIECKIEDKTSCVLCFCFKVRFRKGFFQLLFDKPPSPPPSKNITSFNTQIYAVSCLHVTLRVGFLVLFCKEPEFAISCTPAYNSPSTGSETSKLEKQQCLTGPSSFATAPYKTGIVLTRLRIDFQRMADGIDGSDTASDQRHVRFIFIQSGQYLEKNYDVFKYEDANDDDVGIFTNGYRSCKNLVIKHDHMCKKNALRDWSMQYLGHDE